MEREVDADEAPSAVEEETPNPEQTKVDIEKFSGTKNWLGGFRHKVNETGLKLFLFKNQC